MTDVAMDAAVAAGRDAEFVSYVAARQGALLRTAVLLTGDRHAAEALLQTTPSPGCTSHGATSGAPRRWTPTSAG